MTGKRPSGGARETQRRARIKSEARGPRYDARSLARFRGLRRAGREPAVILGEAMDFIREAMRQAAEDVGLDPSQRREQIGRLGAALAKASDPMRQLHELGLSLRSMSENVAQLEAELSRRGGVAGNGRVADPAEEKQH